MTIISVLGAKGGCGASLVATNLGVFLAGQDDTLLVDLSPGVGCDDLLLDLAPVRSWVDLLPVATELNDRHLEITSVRHGSGLHLLQAPQGRLNEFDAGTFHSLLLALAEKFAWLLLDLPSGMGEITRVSLSISDVVLLVSTADPPALRAAQRLSGALLEGLKVKMGLVLNQITRRHPAKPQQVADSLAIPLLAALPPDPRGVGYQVNFGRPCALDGRSSLGRAINGLGRRLLAVMSQRDRHVVGEGFSVAQTEETYRRDANDDR